MKKRSVNSILKIEMNYVCQQFENYEMHYTYLSDTYMNLEPYLLINDPRCKLLCQVCSNQ